MDRLKTMMIKVLTHQIHKTRIKMGLIIHKIPATLESNP